LPCEMMAGVSADSLGLNGHETFDIQGLSDLIAKAAEGDPGRELTVNAHKEDGSQVDFQVKVRLDTPQEVQYYLHGGILQYVLRQLL
ncbi:MAG: hypothetical protein AAF657_23045, partial [Acidobacteriota bacterium]